jgi:hypothetical protein
VLTDRWRLQECDAYFFCLEDRALLCQSCDVAVHTANDLVSAHRRFLLTGVQVGQEEQGSDDSGRSTEQPGPFGQEGGFGWAAAPDAAGSLPVLSLAVSERLELGSPDPRHEAASKRSPAFGAGQGRVAGGVMDWPLGEFFRGVSDFGDGFGFSESGNSKVSTARLCSFLPSSLLQFNRRLLTYSGIPRLKRRSFYWFRKP